MLILLSKGEKLKFLLFLCLSNLFFHSLLYDTVGENFAFILPSCFADLKFIQLKLLGGYDEKVLCCLGFGAVCF